MESNAVVGEANGAEEQMAEEYSPEKLALEEQKMAAPGSELSVSRLIQLMQVVTESWDKQQCDIIVYADMYIEWTKLFKHMGPALSIAFKDISDKSNAIRNNKFVQLQEQNAAEGSPESMYIHQFVELEKNLNC